MCAFAILFVGEKLFVMKKKFVLSKKHKIRHIMIFNDEMTFLTGIELTELSVETADMLDMEADLNTADPLLT